MDPILMIIIALALPGFFCLLLFAPAYGGLCAAMYLFYGAQVKPFFYDPLYMIELYDTVYNYWLVNRDLLSFMDFLLPVFGPFMVGSLLGLYWCLLFIKYVKNIFRI